MKKPKGKKRCRKDSVHNRKLARERVVVEHVIGRLKKFGVMGCKFRNRLDRYDSMTSIICGLINLRVMLREGMELEGFVG